MENTSKFKEPGILVSRNGNTMYLSSSFYRIMNFSYKDNTLELSIDSNNLSPAEENTLLDIFGAGSPSVVRLDKFIWMPEFYAEFNGMMVRSLYRQTCVGQTPNFYSSKICVTLSYSNAEVTVK